MLISDPKGELYSLHAKSLINRGYEVKILDLRNPYCSIRWNPLERPFEMYQEMLSLDDKVRINEEEGYYVFEDKIYYNEDEKNSAVQVRKQEIFDEVYEDLNDICSVLCPVTNKSEPIWESGAKNFILAICLAMLEDSENPELGMTKEKFNFFNIMKIATNTQNDCEDLMEYFQHRSPISKSVSLSKQVLDASDKTRGSYLSTIFDKLSLFADMSICSLTSANEINFGDIATKPTALFLQIPDEKETRHTLAAMVILQAYKALVAKANTYPDLSLPRSVYFLLDEFGNLPKVHKLEQMITVGRSRKIWLALVVQSYAQLAKVYDDKSRYQPYIRIGEVRISVGSVSGKYENRELSVTEHPLKAGENFYLPFSWGIKKARSYTFQKKTYTEEEIRRILSGNFQQFCKDLEEKGIQIRENSVKIHLYAYSASASGTLWLNERITEEADTEILTIERKETDEPVGTDD